MLEPGSGSADSAAPPKISRKALVVVATLGVLLISALGIWFIASLAPDKPQISVPTAEDERRYIDFARYLSDDFSGDDAQLLRAGYAQCAALDSGSTKEELRISALSNGGSAEAVDAIILAAVTSLCPRHS